MSDFAVVCQQCRAESDTPVCAECFGFIVGPRQEFHFNANDSLVPCPGFSVCPTCKAQSKVTGRMQVVGIDHKNGTITIESV